MAGTGAFLDNVYQIGDGQAVPRGTNVRLRGYMIYNPGVSGTMTLRDGGAGGQVVYTVRTMGAANTSNPPWEAEGYRFRDGIHVTMTPAGCEVSLDVDGYKRT